jgi:hypothetical protein
VSNPINRYSGQRRRLDLYIQNESPGQYKEHNWLPAPKDNFIPMMRLRVRVSATRA